MGDPSPPSIVTWMPILTGLAAAALTAFIGNRLLQRWQQRNWVHQQQFSGLEKEYVALKALTDALLRDCGERLSAMRELNDALGRGSYDTELLAYRQTISTWNRGLHAYFAQLTFQLSWDVAYELENSIHLAFVSTGQRIQGEIRSQRAGNPPNPSRLGQCTSDLDRLAGTLAAFGRQLVRKTEERRQSVFYGKKLFYTKSDIIWLSNFELIKLLFESDIDGFSVVRPTLDVSLPLGARL